MRMRNWNGVAFSLLLLCSLPVAAKDKKKVLLTDDVLEARTVLVVVDPDTGVAADDPLANRNAQEAVEKALMEWGRFQLALNASDADLIISVRRGNGKIVQPTVGGVPINNRPGIFEPTDSGGRAVGQRGNPPAGDPTSSQSPMPGPHVETGQPQDMFSVFRGRRDYPLDSPAVWRFTAKNALRSPGVPAVEEFRKVIAEAEKQRAAQAVSLRHLTVQYSPAGRDFAGSAFSAIVQHASPDGISSLRLPR